MLRCERFSERRDHAMHERDKLPKQGLPPRDRNADVPEHANNAAMWIGAVVAIFALLGLVLFATTRMNDTTAINPNLATEGTMGAAPAPPAKNPS
jgi:hypothetical protein